METILIVGGAGYIGSHVLLELARLNRYKLIVFDNLVNGHKEALEIISQATGAEIKLIVGDLKNFSEIDSVFKETKITKVIHLAALIEAGVSMEFPLKFFDNNIAGTINLLKAMQSNNVRKIVFSSTASVCGSPKSPIVTELTTANPENWYAYSKYVVENILRSLVLELTNPDQRIDSIILRYFNAAGANPELLIGQDYPRPTHLITLAVQASLGIREKLLIFGNDYPTADGTCIRDYIHVSDLAAAHIKALDFLSADGHSGSEIFNIGRGEGTSNLEVVKMMIDMFGEFKYEFAPRRPGDAINFYADSTKAHKILNWEAKYTLKDIIRDSYNWQKNNLKGYSGKK